MRVVYIALSFFVILSYYNVILKTYNLREGNYLKARSEAAQRDGDVVRAIQLLINSLIAKHCKRIIKLTQGST